MYFWIYTGSIAALALTINILGRINNIPGMSLSMLLDTLLYVMVIPVFLVAGIVDMVTAEENKHQTMRNVITFGVPRYKLILSKIIVSIILSFITAFIVLGLFYGSAAVLFGIDPGVKAILPIVSVRILTAVPLWIGAVTLGTFLGMAINNNTQFGFAHAGVFFLTSKIISILSYVVSDKFTVVNKYLITTRLTSLRTPEIPSNELWLSALIGLAYTLVFAGLSILFFNKKEVK
jgi:ABC-2 type transport system permease protein